jgi:hypothetical protein
MALLPASLPDYPEMRVAGRVSRGVGLVSGSERARAGRGWSDASGNRRAPLSSLLFSSLSLSLLF